MSETIPEDGEMSEPMISYRHGTSERGPRFIQYAKDPIPKWAQDIRPHDENTEPEMIPEADAWKTARKMFHQLVKGGTCTSVTDYMAHAILSERDRATAAERARCARIAEDDVHVNVRYPESTAMSIAAAIRNPMEGRG